MIAVVNINERELVSLLAKGESLAFEQLYHLYSERLLGYLIKLVKVEDIACELLQDVFMKVWSNHGKIDPDLSFRSYLFRIAENVTCDFFRKAAREKKIQQQLKCIATSGYSHVEENLFSKEDVVLLHSVIGSLPPQRRQVFQLIKLEGKSYVEVSKELNISVSTISDHIVKATKFIRKQLQDEQTVALSIFVYTICKL